MEEFEDLSLGELFSLSDHYGDRYLTPEEIATRDREFEELCAEIESLAQ